MTISPRAGALRHVITIEQKTGVKGESGAVTTVWATFITTRAAMWPTKGKEIVIDDKLTMQTLFTIRIRYQPGIKPSMRIKFGTRYFDILQMPNMEERNVLLDFVCKEDV